MTITYTELVLVKRSTLERIWCKYAWGGGLWQVDHGMAPGGVDTPRGLWQLDHGMAPGSVDTPRGLWQWTSVCPPGHVETPRGSDS